MFGVLKNLLNIHKTFIKLLKVPRKKHKRNRERVAEMYPECVIASWDALILLLDAENIE